MALAAALCESVNPYTELMANPRPGLAASELVSSTNKITLLEGSNLDKVANWSLPPDEYSNRVSSITADNIKFLRCESGALLMGNWS